MSSSSSQPPFDFASRTAYSYPKRVLIVDDNSFVRQALTEIFKREVEFQVCGEAANGKEAVRAAESLRPDVIVLDLAMPVMNGLDAARMLKRLMRSVAIIMYSDVGDRYVVTASQTHRNRSAHRQS